MNMDIEQIARVVGLVEGSQLLEVTITSGGQSVRVVNNLQQRDTTDSLKPASSSIDTIKQTDTNNSNKPAQITATYVGCVYLSADDTMDNLVSKGDYVEKGQTVCFIDELSRLMPVVSDKAGTVTGILVKNGDKVEYGQPIFSLEV